MIHNRLRFVFDKVELFFNFYIKTFFFFKFKQRSNVNEFIYVKNEKVVLKN